MVRGAAHQRRQVRLERLPNGGQHAAEKEEESFGNQKMGKPGDQVRWVCLSVAGGDEAGEKKGKCSA